MQMPDLGDQVAAVHLHRNQRERAHRGRDFLGVWADLETLPPVGEGLELLELPDQQVFPE